MARGTTYEVLGVSGIVADLVKTNTAIAAAVERVNRDTALAVSSRAKALAPRRTGDLANAISFAGKGLRWLVGIEDRSYPSRGGNTAHQNPWVYGVWYEFGFVTRQIAQHPFMGPAADAEEPLHEQRIAGAVDAALR